MEKREIRRQLIHIFAGLAFIVFLFLSDRVTLIGVTFLIIIGGSLLINFALVGEYVPIAHDIGKELERKKRRFPGWGPAWYAWGILLLAVVLTDINEISAGIFILGVGDGLSTLVGIKGKNKLPYNHKKTFEGTAAFFIASLIAYYFVGWSIVPLALIAAIVESLPWKIDDNLAVPFFCAVFFMIF